MCFKDIYPAAPHHYLVVPIEHIKSCHSLRRKHVDLGQVQDYNQSTSVAMTTDAIKTDLTSTEDTPTAAAVHLVMLLLRSLNEHTNTSARSSASVYYVI